MKNMHLQFRNRINGESFSKITFLLSNQIELILQKFNSVSSALHSDTNDRNKVNESDIQALLASTEEWSVLIDKTVTSGSSNEGTTKDNT